MKTDRTIRFIDTPMKREWNACANHPLQSWEWGEFRKAMGIDVVRVGVYSGSNLTDVWQMTFHSIPHTPFTIGYFPKGPAPDPFMIAGLKKIASSKGAVFIQLEPDCVKGSVDVPRMPELRLSHRPLFTKYTFVIDLTKSENELLASMHPKTRYNIRVAQKRGVTIREDPSEDAFQKYLELSEETTRRQGFYAHNTRYHTTLRSVLRTGGMSTIFTATYQGTVLAAWMLFLWKKTIYYPYGASSRSNREVMAPNLLLWEIIRWGKSRHYVNFDLWGALGPDPDTHDPWYGFHRFKEGYHPDTVEFIGSYDVIIRPVLYRLYETADTIRWHILHAKKH